MSKSLEEIAQETCEFEIGCTVCSGYEETRYTDQSTNTTPDRATDNQPTVNKQLDEVIDFCFRCDVSWTIDQLEGTSYYNSAMAEIEENKKKAKAKLQRLIVEARIEQSYRCQELIEANRANNEDGERYGEIALLDVDDLTDELKELENDQL